ncbi:MAG TPA: 50S ribosomal protein L21 [Sphingomicrobium sp.]|nr:50S ribosomal protein L21 [Sphingomicrobium sp.]
MFAIVRTGGKQYRVAPGDKIVVEKLDGNAGDKITLGDVLLAGEGSSLKSTDGLTVAAEIIAQAKADKVTVFKKRRRHNYRRKKGHRQQHTILKIVAIGDYKEAKKAAPKAEAKPAAAAPQPAAEKPAAHAKAKAEAESDQQKAGDVVGTPTESPAPSDDKAAGAEKPAVKKAAAPKAKTPSTKNAAPAKAAAKKTPKAK